MRRRFVLSTALADFLSLGFAIATASLMSYGQLPWAVSLTRNRSIWPMIVLLGIGAVISTILAHQVSSRSGVPRPTYGRAVAVVGIALAVVPIGIITTRQTYWSNTFIVETGMLWLAGSLLHRVVRRRRPWTEPMVIISSQKELIDDLRNSPHVDMIGVLDPGTTGEVAPLPTGVTVAVDLREVLSDRMAQFVSSCNLAGYNVAALSTVYEQHTGRMPIVHLAEGWELSAPVTRTAPYLGGKRAFDLLAVLATAIVWVPLSAVIAIAVLIGSGRPVIFKQVRVGRHGQPFTLYKFRTMINGSEQLGPKFANPNDDRLTPVGRVLRRFRVDELPQLFNVLKGDLSLVGPRPEQVDFVARFDAEIPFYAHRHLIRPGVTGWAQVNYGYADDQAETIDKLTFDLYYVKHMSPWLDLEILGQSIWTVLSGYGAR